MGNNGVERLEKFVAIGSDDVEVKVQGVLVKKGERGALRHIRVIRNVDTGTYEDELQFVDICTVKWKPLKVCREVLCDYSRLKK